MDRHQKKETTETERTRNRDKTAYAMVLSFADISLVILFHSYHRLRTGLLLRRSNRNSRFHTESNFCEQINRENLETRANFLLPFTLCRRLLSSIMGKDSSGAIPIGTDGYAERIARGRKFTVRSHMNAESRVCGMP